MYRIKHDPTYIAECSVIEDYIKSAIFNTSKKCTFAGLQQPQDYQVLDENELFLEVLGKALTTVQTVSVTCPTPPESKYTYPSADTIGERHNADFYLPVLQQLSSALPALRAIEVYGPIHKDALKAFGESCPRLSRLDISAKHQQHDSFKEFSTLLPMVDSLCFHNKSSYDYIEVERDVEEALECLDGRNIKHLDFGERGTLLDGNTWAKLPLGLVTLRVNNKRIEEHRFSEFGQHARYQHEMRSRVFPELSHITWNCTLQEALSMKRKCPKLSSFEGTVHTSCERSEVERWDEWAAIAQSSSFKWSGELVLTEPEDQVGFLKDVRRPMRGVTHVTFLTSYGREYGLKRLSDKTLLPRLFPAVTHLTINQAYNNQVLALLLHTRYLKHLELGKIGWDGTTMLGLGMLCAMHPRIASLTVKDNRGIGYTDFKNVLSSFGCRVVAK